MESNAGEEKTQVPHKLTQEDIARLEYEAAVRRFREWLDQHPFDPRTAFRKIYVPPIPRD